jgi:hypothetical protein
MVAFARSTKVRSMLAWMVAPSHDDMPPISTASASASHAPACNGGMPPMRRTLIGSGGSPQNDTAVPRGSNSPTRSRLFLATVSRCPSNGPDHRNFWGRTPPPALPNCAPINHACLWAITRDWPIRGKIQLNTRRVMARRRRVSLHFRACSPAPMVLDDLRELRPWSAQLWDIRAVGRMTLLPTLAV